VLLVGLVICGLFCGLLAGTESVSSVVADREIDGRVASVPADGYLGIDTRSRHDDGRLEVTVIVQNHLPTNQHVQVRVRVGRTTKTERIGTADWADAARFHFVGIACGATFRVVGTNPVTRIVYDRSLTCPSTTADDSPARQSDPEQNETAPDGSDADY
jgi:hypothetical protein